MRFVIISLAVVGLCSLMLSAVVAHAVLAPVSPARSAPDTVRALDPGMDHHRQPRIGGLHARAIVRLRGYALSIAVLLAVVLGAV